MSGIRKEEQRLQRLENRLLSVLEMLQHTGRTTDEVTGYLPWERWAVEAYLNVLVFRGFARREGGKYAKTTV